MKVLLIVGGQSSEHTISRMSASHIRKEIDENKYDVTSLGIDKEGHWYQLSDSLRDFSSDQWLEGATPVSNTIEYLQSFDVVFPVLHGMYGEDGTIQGLLTLADVPYVGCRVTDSAVAMDKIVGKKLFAMAGIKQTPSVYVKKRYDGRLVVVNDDTSEEDNVVETIKETLGLPVFVKASRSGSSVGCYKVSHEDKLLAKLEEAAVYDKKILVEKAIDCTELECAVLGNDDVMASRVGQILPHGEFYTFESKYQDEQSATCIPARVEASVQDYIRETAVKAFKAVDGHGLARCDFFLDNQTGEVYLNEINTLPGFTPISMYPKLINDTGMSTSALIDRLIELAFQK